MGTVAARSNASGRGNSRPRPAIRRPSQSESASTQIFFVASSVAALFLWSIAYFAVAAVSHVAALTCGAAQFDWLPTVMSPVFLILAYPKAVKPLMALLNIVKVLKLGKQ
jgi:hypothetical protein